MEYVYAALMLHKAGKKVDEASLKKVIEAAGIEPNIGKIKALVSALEGVNIEEVLKQAPVASAAPAPSHEEKKGAEKHPEPKKEEKGKTEEAAAEGLGALFG